MIYNLIETATGRNHSQSSAPIPDPKDGFHVVETAGNVGIWNESTLVFDPIPESKKYSKHDFYKKVTHALYYKAHAASKNNIPIESFLRYLEGMATVDLNDGELQQGVALMVSELVWTQDEADEVLA